MAGISSTGFDFSCYAYDGKDVFAPVTSSSPGMVILQYCPFYNLKLQSLFSIEINIPKNVQIVAPLTVHYHGVVNY